MFLWLDLTGRRGRGQTEAICPPGVGEELAPQSLPNVQTMGEIHRGDAAYIRQVDQKISFLIILDTRHSCTNISIILPGYHQDITRTKFSVQIPDETCDMSVVSEGLVLVLSV